MGSTAFVVTCTTAFGCVDGATEWCGQAAVESMRLSPAANESGNTVTEWTSCRSASIDSQNTWKSLDCRRRHWKKKCYTTSGAKISRSFILLFVENCALQLRKDSQRRFQKKLLKKTPQRIQWDPNSQI